MLYTHLADAAGIAALALNVSGLLTFSDRSMLKVSARASALWSLNSLLIGAPRAAALSAQGVRRRSWRSVPVVSRRPSVLPRRQREGRRPSANRDRRGRVTPKLPQFKAVNTVLRNLPLLKSEWVDLATTGSRAGEADVANP
jgi:hypothetical protein